MQRLEAGRMQNFATPCLATSRRLPCAVLTIAAFCLVLAWSTPALFAAQSLHGKGVRVWLTTADRTSLLQEQQALKWHAAKAAQPADITMDDTKTFQTMDGFGHALTGGSAQLLMKMSPPARKALLQELFGGGPGGIDTSYIRVTIGASDMNDHVYTYDDMPAGEVDPDLAHFSLAEDEKEVIPVLKEIVGLQPGIRILASPWTAPSWMKSNGNPKGGELQERFYSAYAAYLVRYVQAMRAEGITVDALTVQNEPENPKNTPSMLVTAEQEATFIGHDLGPALQRAGLKTKIIAFDHNCDHPEYPLTVLRDPSAGKYTDGSGFHLYLGQITALTTVHNAFPAKNIYFTEQMVIPGRDATRMNAAEPVAKLIIGAPENWSRSVLLWNLAADPQNGPHTPDGGCPICTGALRIDGDTVTRLVAYYVAAHASKFVPPASVRIPSTSTGGPPHVAFRTPDKHHVLIVSNTTGDESRFRICQQGKAADAVLPAGAVATFVW